MLTKRKSSLSQFLIYNAKDLQAKKINNMKHGFMLPPPLKIIFDSLGITW
jgi:hypothetical protein